MPQVRVHDPLLTFDNDREQLIYSAWFSYTLSWADPRLATSPCTRVLDLLMTRLDSSDSVNDREECVCRERRHTGARTNARAHAPSPLQVAHPLCVACACGFSAPPAARCVSADRARRGAARPAARCRFWVPDVAIQNGAENANDLLHVSLVRTHLEEGPGGAPSGVASGSADGATPPAATGFAGGGARSTASREQKTVQNFDVKLFRTCTPTAHAPARGHARRAW